MSHPTLQGGQLLIYSAADAHELIHSSELAPSDALTATSWRKIIPSSMICRWLCRD